MNVTEEVADIAWPVPSRREKSHIVGNGGVTHGIKGVQLFERSKILLGLFHLVGRKCTSLKRCFRSLNQSGTVQKPIKSSARF